MSVTEEALAIARILVKHLPEIREGLELVKELKVREGRNAEAGDLEDSIEKLRSLDRSGV